MYYSSIRPFVLFDLKHLASGALLRPILANSLKNNFQESYIHHVFRQFNKRAIPYMALLTTAPSVVQ